MKTILEYLRLTFFVGGVLIGVQIPSFVDQYGQRLESHFIESTNSLEGFQADADKYFEGDIGKLIQHYAKNPDSVINDGGKSIEKLYSRARFLATSWSTFSSSVYQRYWHVFASPVGSIQHETWRGYGFTVKLDLDGIAWALSIGVILSALIELCLRILNSIFKLLVGSNKPKRKEPLL